MQLIMCSFLSWLPGSSECSCALRYGAQVISFFLYLCSLFSLLILFFFKLTFSFVPLIVRILKMIWKVVHEDEINKYKSEMYTEHLSFKTYLFYLLQKKKKVEGKLKEII